MEEHPISSDGDDLAQEGSLDDLDGSDIGSNLDGGSWQDPCEQYATCAAIAEADPCADLASDSDAWEECHEGTEGQEWAADLESCLGSKTSSDWGDLLHCAEEEVSVPSQAGDDLAQTSGDDDDHSVDEIDNDADSDELAQTSGDDSGSDPCRHLAPCADIMENDPCEDADDWSACHEGDEGQAWAAELETCLNNKTEEQWAAEFKCWEEHPIEE